MSLSFKDLVWTLGIMMDFWGSFELALSSILQAGRNNQNNKMRKLYFAKCIGKWFSSNSLKKCFSNLLPKKTCHFLENAIFHICLNFANHLTSNIMHKSIFSKFKTSFRNQSNCNFSFFDRPRPCEHSFERNCD